MSVVRTEDEALALLQDALVAWRHSSSVAARQAALAARRLQDAAERTMAGHLPRLAAAATEDQGGRGEPLAARAAAEAQVRHLADVVVRYADLVAQLDIVRRRLDGPAAAAAAAAGADLDRRRRQLEQYRTGGRAARSGDAATSLSTAGSAATDVLAARGLEEVALDEVSFEDNPLVGTFGRGGTTAADYRWAVETWETTVRPGIAAGLRREDFEARDLQRSAAPLRRTADVFDLFLGDTDRVRLSRRPGGDLEVVNGRHRIQVARDLGLRSLPASIT